MVMFLSFFFSLLLSHFGLPCDYSCHWQPEWCHHERKVKVLVIQSCLTLCDPMDCSPPGSSVHGICQARILGWASMPSFKESSWSTDWSRVSFVSCIAFFTHWAARKAQVQVYNIVIHNSWRLYSIIFQSLRKVWLSATSCTVACQASLSFIIS